MTCIAHFSSDAKVYQLLLIYYLSDYDECLLLSGAIINSLAQLNSPILGFQII